jgi:hypothetical protein
MNDNINNLPSINKTVPLKIVKKKKSASSLVTTTVDSLTLNNENKKQRKKKESIKKSCVLNPEITLPTADDLCGICGNGFETIAFYKTSCTHYFHQNCLRNWFNKIKKLECPYCRSKYSPIVWEDYSHGRFKCRTKMYTYSPNCEITSTIADVACATSTSTSTSKANKLIQSLPVPPVLNVGLEQKNIAFNNVNIKQVHQIINTFSKIGSSVEIINQNGCVITLEDFTFDSD